MTNDVKLEISDIIVDEPPKPKLRADFFLEIADDAALQIIQGEAQQYKNDEDYSGNNMQSSFNLLTLYLQISMDEGYRRVMEEMKENSLTRSKINIVPRKKGWFEYIEDEKEVKEVLSLLKRRIKSKRMRKRIAKDWEEQGKEWSEEEYVFMMTVHTGWEHGYIKANTMKHIAKITCGGDADRADLILRILNEVFTDEVMEKMNEKY